MCAILALTDCCIIRSFFSLLPQKTHANEIFRFDIRFVWFSGWLLYRLRVSVSRIGRIFQNYLWNPFKWLEEKLQRTRTRNRRNMFVALIWINDWTCFVLFSFEEQAKTVHWNEFEDSCDIRWNDETKVRCKWNTTWKLADNDLVWKLTFLLNDRGRLSYIFDRDTRREEACWPLAKRFFFFACIYSDDAQITEHHIERIVALLNVWIHRLLGHIQQLTSVWQISMQIVAIMHTFS